MSKSYYFGIDGGGTHSRIAIVDSFMHPIANTTGESTNIYAVSSETVKENLSNLLQTALSDAAIPITAIKAGCIGSAGLSRPAEIKLFRDFFSRILGSVPVKLCSDGEILLCGGLLSTEGYCLISGTGSLALGRSADGNLVRAGGLGYMLGDEGSAWWIGHEALSRTLRSIEGRDIPTDMLPQLLDICGVKEHDDLIEFVHHRATKADIGAIAPSVTNAAEHRDPLALNILHCAAEELALLVKSVVSQSPDIKKHHLVLAGGVMEHDAIVAAHLVDILAKDLPAIEVTKPKGTALQGACILAKDMKYS